MKVWWNFWSHFHSVAHPHSFNLRDLYIWFTKSLMLAEPINTELIESIEFKCRPHVHIEPSKEQSNLEYWWPCNLKGFLKHFKLGKKPYEKMKQWTKKIDYHNKNLISDDGQGPTQQVFISTILLFTNIGNPAYESYHTHHMPFRSWELQQWQSKRSKIAKKLLKMYDRLIGPKFSYYAMLSYTKNEVPELDKHNNFTRSSIENGLLSRKLLSTNVQMHNFLI